MSFECLRNPGIEKMKKFPQITIEIKKNDGERYRQATVDRGMSLTGLLKAGVDEYIQNHPVEKEQRLRKLKLISAKELEIFEDIEAVNAAYKKCLENSVVYSSDEVFAKLGVQ